MRGEQRGEPLEIHRRARIGDRQGPLRGEPECREAGAGAARPRDPLGIRPQARVGVEQPTGQRLVALRLLGRDPEAAQLLPRGGLGRGEHLLHARRRRDVVEQSQCLAPPGCGAEYEHQLRARPRAEIHRAPQGEDGVEHASGRTRQRRTRSQGLGPVEAGAASDEARAVGLVLERAVAEQRVHHPREALAALTRPAAREQRAAPGIEFGLDEELRERQVAPVGGVPGEHDFDVAGQVERARARGAVAQRDPPHLQRRPRRHHGLEARLDAVVVARDLHPPRPPGRPVVARRAPDRLRSERPQGARLPVTQVEEAAVAILDPVAGPAGERQLPQPRAPGSGGAEEGGVVAVREQPCRRRRSIERIRRGARERAREARAGFTHGDHLLEPRPSRRPVRSSTQRSRTQGFQAEVPP